MRVATTFLVLLLTMAPLVRAADKAVKAVPTQKNMQSDTISSGEGEFKVLFDTETREVEVLREGQNAAPPYLRLKVLRRKQPPLEIKLHAIERPETQPPGMGRYVGKADTWNGSVAGFEIDISFDKQVWKKIKRALK